MIRRIFPALIGAIIATTWCGGQALASTTPTLISPNQMELKLGAYFPGSSNAQFFGGQTQLTAGLDYNLSSSGGLTPSATGLYFDYMGGSRHEGYVHGGGIGLDVRAVTGPAFFGAGLGLYNTSVRNAEGLSASKTGAGGKVFAGLNMGKNSLELDYHVMPSSLGINPSGVGLSFGFKL